MSWRDREKEFAEEPKTSTPASTSSWRQREEEFKQTPPTTAGRRGGTRRELMGAYGAGQMAPGQVTPVTGPESIPALAAGVGRGVSGGLTSYISPLFMGGPESYKEKLAEVRRIEEQVKQQYPISSGLGELAGTTMGAGGAMKVAGKVAPAIVAIPAGGALYSGVSEATRPESTMGSVAGAAALGGTTAAIPGIGVKAGQITRDVLVKNKYIANQAGYAERFRQAGMEAAEQVQPTLLKAGEKMGYKMEDLLTPGKKGTESSLEVLEAIRKNKVPGMKIPEAERDLAKATLVSFNARERSLEKIEAVKDLTGNELRYKVKGSLKGSASQETKQAIETVRDLIPTIGKGAVFGGTLSALSGGDPMSGAQAGAAFFGLTSSKIALGRALQHQALKTASRIPTVSATPFGAMGATAGIQATPYVMRPQQPQMAAPIELPPLPETTTTEESNLDRLLERVRQTYGSQ